MKVNKKLRIKVCKRKIIILDKKLKNCNPYGYEDCQKIYEDLTYYEYKLQELKHV